MNHSRNSCALQPAKHLCRLLLLLATILFWLTPAWAKPKSFNLYLRNYFEASDIETLSHFDAVGLDADLAVTPEYSTVISQLKTRNPNIKVLAYIPINGTYANANIFTNPQSNWKKMYQYAEQQAATRWLWSVNSTHIQDHPGKYTINLTFACSNRHTRSAGQLQAPNCAASETNKLNWYVDFILNDVLQNGNAAWDGVILDDVWVGISFINSDLSLNPSPIDFDRDGIADPPANLDPLWKQGNRWIAGEVRRRMDLNPSLSSKVLIGNGGNDFYTEMNGAFMETFPFNGPADAAPNPLGYSWQSKMFQTYGYFANEDNYWNVPQRLNVVNTKWDVPPSTPPARSYEFLQRLRFVLASVLLRDGYVSLDAPAHNSNWWQIEFEKELGTALAAPYQFTSNGMNLWRRDYSGGTVVINPNYSTYTGSTSLRLPPIPWLDAAVLNSAELWSASSTAPPSVSDLTVVRSTNSLVEVEWSNVNCPDNPTIGQCTVIDLRYSNAPITDANWSSALQAATPVPDAPGRNSKQRYTISSGLQSGQTYYFALKTSGLSAVWSGVSNNVSALTQPSDSIAPSSISDLRVTSTSSTEASVAWTAPGDDAQNGQASSFDLRYWTAGGSYTNGAQVVGEPSPGPAGSNHSMNLYGLTPNQTYFFGIRSADEMPNWSATSNIASASTQAGDTTPPAAITDLRVISTGGGWILLSWTAPGDDGQQGRATSYDLRYRPKQGSDLNLINASNFASSNYITTEPGPELAGTEQSLLIGPLGNDGYTYSFAIKTCDEFPNCSAISNVVSATTRAGGDVSAPAAVSDLRITQVSNSSVTLSWTDSGDDGTQGSASQYDLRYLNVPISTANFSQGTRVNSMPTPGPAGSSGSVTVSGLTANMDYYFAIRIGDEVPIFSTISNAVLGRTSTDQMAPAAPFSLTVN